ncbi:MAG: hypothetical protein LBF71_03195 [Campylobacteraceae bacterium]|jgi:intein/homing endonuclease|nr:hypothetical protein [Campylobacteraceae bacterium]
MEATSKVNLNVLDLEGVKKDVRLNKELNKKLKVLSKSSGADENHRAFSKAVSIEDTVEDIAGDFEEIVALIHVLKERISIMAGNNVTRKNDTTDFVIRLLAWRLTKDENLEKQ